MNKKIPPIHPGEILFEEFLKPMGISQNRLAIDIRVPARRINEIVLKKRRITTDTALRLAKYLFIEGPPLMGTVAHYQALKSDTATRHRPEDRDCIYRTSRTLG